VLPLRSFSAHKYRFVKIDRNQILGMALLFGIFLLWSVMNTPSKEEVIERQRVQDSIVLAAKTPVPTPPPAAPVETPDTATTQIVEDSTKLAVMNGRFGVFAAAAQGTPQDYVLENEAIRITFSNKCGRIKEVLLKHYQKLLRDENRKEYKVPLYLLEDERNVFAYEIPAGDRVVRSDELYFTAQEEPGAIVFTASGANGAAFTQTYKIAAEGYAVDYDIRMSGIPGSALKNLKLNWVNYLDRIELNTNYERYYTSVYYRDLDEDSPDYCSCRQSDIEDRSSIPLKWVSHSNQFFNSSLIADTRFSGGVLSTEMLEDTDENLKILRSDIDIPLSGSATEDIGMSLYLGPNDFEDLRKFNVALEDVIPFGRSIFGTINRWVMRPLFNLLSSGVVNMGFVILLLTLLVKLVLYPLTYKMLHSQAKMGVLKPRLAKLREKHKDDMQKQQMETMKVYREYGVSPLGGCLPMVLQMPIWFALYRFFPASIEFRQAKFLWATDLSSYDVFMYLPFEIPFYGAHISLFTILWAGTTVLYTHYNMRHMDMGAMGNQKVLMYMQYFMPIMFLFFFNNYASGLTLYLLFSNVINIGLTLGTKHFIFNDEKIMAELNINKEKPKKRSGFSQRLETALKEQQRAQEERKKSKR
jgi:YidC/Oxa1 family membrane protein insertase